MKKNNNFKPFFTIIMNCHNGEKYLKKSLDSLLDQSYSNWELIFWDNQSQDNSKLILESYNEKKFKYYYNENKTTLYRARNLAIEKANGDYICFLDTDDFWAPNKLEEQIKFLENNKNFEIVYSNFYTIKKDGTKYIQNNHNLPEGKIIKDLLKNYSIGILTVCLKREIFKNILFDEKTNIIGDFDLFIKLSYNHNIGCIQKPLAFYRVHENNLSKKKLEIYINELEIWIKNNNEKFKKLGISLIYVKFFLLKLRFKSFLKKMGH